MTVAPDIARAWRRTLASFGLDDIERADFATVGLAGRLTDPTIQLLVLPGHPGDEQVELDSGLWDLFEEHRKPHVAGRRIELGSWDHPTAHAAAYMTGENGRAAPWTGYVAIHRNGAVEAGLGNHGGANYRTERDGEVRAFRLVPTVVRVAALLQLHAAVVEHASVDGPFQLTVALRNTGGALLGGLGQGWAEPLTPENSASGCHDPNLLWHVVLDEPVRDEDALRVGTQIGDRLEDAWGVRQRRYLDHSGDRAGNVNSDRR